MEWNTLRLIMAGLSCGASLLFSFLLFYRGGRRRISVYFGFCNLFLGLWNSCDVFATFAPNNSTALLIDRLSFFWGFLLIGVFFKFCWEFIGPSFVSQFVLRLHAYITVALLPLVFTPLIVKDFTVRPRFVEVPGPLYWVFATHFLLTMGYGLFALRRSWVEAEGEQRNRIKYMFLAFVFAALAGVTYVWSTFSPKVPHFYYFFEIVYVSLVPVTILRSRMMEINLALRYTLVYLVMGICLGLPLAGLVWMLSGQPWAAAVSLVAPMGGYFAIQSASPWFMGLVDRLPFFQGKYDGLKNLEQQEKRVALSGDLRVWAQRLLEGAFALVKPELGFVLVREESERAYLVKAEIGLDAARRVFLSVPFDGPLAVRAREGKMILADSAGAEDKSEDIAIELKYLGVVVLVPLMCREEVHAFLGLGRKVGRDMLNDVDLAGLYGLARSAELTLNTLLSGTAVAVETKSWVHDLLRPLGPKGILGAFERMENNLQLSPGEVAEAKNEVGFLRRSLTQLLTGGRGIELRRRALSIFALFRTAQKKCEGFFKESGLELAVRAGSEETWVNVDPEWIEHRVLGNLLENAARHTPPGGRIELGGERQDEFFLGWLKDSGAGIEQKLIDKIFEPGVQGDGRKGVSGLGLYSVKTSVEAHGGRVWVESAPGQGTTFFFTLPLAEKKS